MRTPEDKNSPTILLVNAHSLCNAGDAALLQVTISQFRAAFGEPKLFVSTNYPDEPQYDDLGVEALPSVGALVDLKGRLPQNRRLAGYRRLIAAYRRADLVASLPGNQFFSMGRFGRPLFASAASIWLALHYKKPLYILPQSLGPFHRRWEERLVRGLYRQARLVFVREQPSYRLAQGWGLSPQRLLLVHDPAFAFPPAEAARTEAVLRRWGCLDGKPLLGVTVIPPMVRTLAKKSLRNYISSLAGALGTLVQRFDLRPVFFTQSSGPTAVEDDRLAARQVIGLLPDPACAILIDEVLPPAVLKACYGQMSAFIAGRLHSGIFALGMGVPTFFIGYLSKTAAMLETLGWPDWYLPLERIDESVLMEKMSGLWEERLVRREMIRARLPELAGDCGLPVKLIASAA